jgi:hypothetical protein
MTGKDRQQTEKRLRQHRVEDADLIFEKCDAQSAQQPLNANRDEGNDRQIFHPAPRFPSERCRSEYHCHHTHAGGNETVTMFVKNTSHPA